MTDKKLPQRYDKKPPQLYVVVDQWDDALSVADEDDTKEFLAQWYTDGEETKQLNLYKLGEKIQFDIEQEVTVIF